MKNLLIVDANSILNRAYYGIRPLSAPDGTPTNAVYGMVTILKKHLDSLCPEYMAAAFDLKAPTFRHRDYPEYKAGRKPMPEDLAAQLPLAKEMCRALGFTVLECEGFEADDIIGTVCRMGDESGLSSYALTGDRDALQLITDKTSVILVKTKEDVTYTPSRFKEDFGVTPKEYIDVKALMGDSSDNIPGVKGIGEKSAFKLIGECHSLEELYENLENIQIGKSAKEKLTAGRDDAFMSRYLATIVKNAPVCPVEEIHSEGINKKQLSALFERLAFDGLAKRFDLSEERTQKCISCPKAIETTEEELPQSPLAMEIRDEIYLSDGESVFKATTLSDAFFENRKVICHDYKALCRKLKKKPPCAFDTLLAAYLLAPGDSNYKIDRLSSEYLGETQSETSPEAAVYTVARLSRVMEEKLEELGMTKLLHEIELPLSAVLADMEDVGMKLDGKGLLSYSEELKTIRDSLANTIFEACGHPFNLNSPKQLAAVLFEEMGLPAGKKTKTGYSTNSETLEALRGRYEIVDSILHYRELSKLISTYTDVLPKLTDENSRVHTTLSQTVTATGRLSSSEPNLQNIPVRGQIGREIRRYFTAEDGCVLIDADYSQIELRVLAQLSGDENMMSAFLSGEDIHTATAAQVFGVSPLMVDPEMRRRAKAVNFGIVYGIGAFSLSKDLNISRKQAADYIESYFAAYPKVESYLKETVAKATEVGYTKTAFGRIRQIPELSSKNGNLRAFGERVAMNSPIQGTAADIIKLAMLKVSKALSDSGIKARLIMQVHDELIVEAALSDAPKAAEILKSEMESVVNSKVPLLADTSVGANWYEAK